jgi:hypothetical protein
VNCDANFGSPGDWKQDTGWLSVSAWARRALNLAEETVLRNLLGFGQLRFGMSAEADDHQTD